VYNGSQNMCLHKQACQPNTITSERAGGGGGGERERERSFFDNHEVTEGRQVQRRRVTTERESSGMGWWSARASPSDGRSQGVENSDP
jgi:hypothetical protein